MTNASLIAPKSTFLPDYVVSVRMHKFLNDIAGLKRVPYKYLIYHIYKDIVGVNISNTTASMRLHCIDDLRTGVFKSRKVDKKQYLGL